MKQTAIVAIAGVMLITGCSNSSIYGSDVYSADQAKQVQTLTYGTIVSMRPVKIQADGNGNILGTVGGALVGGILGSMVGGGKGQSLSTAAGLIAGGVAGNAINNKVNEIDGIELQIRKDNGETIVVVQKAEKGKFAANQRVQITSHGKTTTVAPARN
jgi:outer membrane lipoprotein SlyB